MKIFQTVAVSLCLALAACGGAVGGDDTGGDGDGGAGDGDGGGIGSDGGGGINDACKKIDLVISVDPSASMATELTAMSAVFGEFATALLDVNDQFENFRTGVIDSCPRPAAFNTSGKAAPCNFQGGRTWIDSASTEMVVEYQCVGDLNTTFDCNTENDEDEQPIKAAIASLQPGINPDFIRNDALLVVMGITDEDEEMVLDDQPEEDPAQAPAASLGLYNSLVAVKGDVKRMVFIGIAGGLPDGCSAGAYGQANPAHVVNATADLFIAEQRGVKWDLCQGDLSQALSNAMTVIEQACDEFEEPIE